MSEIDTCPDLKKCCYCDELANNCINVINDDWYCIPCYEYCDFEYFFEFNEWSDELGKK